MSGKPIRSIVIVGGGTAGWMSAAPLAQRLGAACKITLVESPDIGTIGVGEATLPTIRYYNSALGIDGIDFIKKTQATFKLGIEFKDWGHLGNRFFHGFGDFGPDVEGRSAHMAWLRLARHAQKMPPLEEWSMSTVMARELRFLPPMGDQQSPANAYSYGFHFDAGLYAAYLRDYAMARGVVRIEGMILEAERRPEDGFITALKLQDGRRIEGDLFLDCSGFRGLLIEGTLKAGYDDWSDSLPCDSALAVPCAKVAKLTPYTTSTARQSGWQWRIPLQHRTGNGHVYSSAFTSDEQAARVLLDGLDGRALDEPRQLRFTTGRRRLQWSKNVVAIGLSGGFVEPLESTSINLIETAVGTLMQFFPDLDFRPELANEFNRIMLGRYESVRDFIILHYKLTRRTDSDFWRHCAAMPVPDSLMHQVELFRTSGRVVIYDPAGFNVPSFVSIMMGLGLVPESYDPFLDLIDHEQLRKHFAGVRSAIASAAQGMPDHTDFIHANLRADPVPGLAV